MARHHLTQYAGTYLTFLVCGTIYGIQLATWIHSEKLEVHNTKPWTTTMNIVMYFLPVMSVERPLPLVLVDSKKFWLAAWLLDSVLKVMVVVYVLLGGSVIFIVARGYGAPLVPTVLGLLLVSDVFLTLFVLNFRTLWLHEGCRVSR